MTKCRNCGIEYDGPSHTCKDPYPIEPQFTKPIHNDWEFEIKVSNDNTKGEKRVTVHVRSDDHPEAAQKLADKLYKDELGS